MTDAKTTIKLDCSSGDYTVITRETVVIKSNGWVKAFDHPNERVVHFPEHRVFEIDGTATHESL
jgi:hypothetical protein